ncbi:dipeptide/oligopeptide/nickel ABC transporter permease/ATP-binding protein [Arthrobacter sp. MMS18-M83]|uniref:dipeptide/oligopeptide/nickel ABC transporter permease/ATP-binding protein n=1 Tax=Arthrobacter sp. MMS18-M83 TaxID=2996261 RepID=UPI002279F876|nr:dipeptide/oligopeptide/nickel ABC transporter permease/ATP-binding protein [Arthrobacter sp. MMS18-M83]WAH96264.1 dipeptide/oligopeptide/nickel ABC transporter permease/ATP-binding protein [Arthrobacter sp. MMS18-M83]
MSEATRMEGTLFAAKLPVVQDKPSRFMNRLFKKPLAIISIAWLMIVITAAVLAPTIAPFDPLEQNLLDIKKLPSAVHWLGTDAFGRDVLSRLLHGSLPTIIGIFQAVAVACVLGFILGLAAGYYGGWLDKTIGQITDLLMALPGLVILLSILAVFNRDMTAAMVTMGIMGCAGIARVIRSSTLNVREELYIEAAKISGLGDNAIIFRHVVPRIVGPMIVQLSMFAAMAVLTQTGISFLGLGVQPPAPTWGGMVYEAAAALNDFPWLLVPAGATIAVTVLAFGLLGDAARDAAAEGWTRTARRRSRRTNTLHADAATDVTKSAGTPAVPEEPAFLTVRGLTIVAQNASEERVLVQSLDLDLDRGETLGIVGESGSGKTLSSLALMGLLPLGTRVTAGTMVLDGRTYDLSRVDMLRALRGATIGMIFQEPMAALDPCFTVEHHLVEVLRRHTKLSRTAAKARAVELLEQVKIPNPADVAQRYPHQISGGMAQRVGIARTLAAKPKVLLADEPTTALDVTVQADILDLLRELSTTDNMAVILVTHDWGVVADICDRALVLYHGETLESAPVRKIFSHPEHPYTKALLKANPHNAVVGQPLPTIQDSLENLLAATGGRTEVKETVV